MTKRAFSCFFLCAAAAAFLFRMVQLDRRPMHHDEANQAYKFGELLERGEYRYDPDEHHGPSLYYLTLPAARAAAVKTYAGLNETMLRSVPALFGAGVLLWLLLIGDGLSKKAVLYGGTLIALSPFMTFYSRYYIQESLLVFFLAGFLATGWHLMRKPSALWAVAAGFTSGMMFATKETSLILFGSIGAAVLFERLLRGQSGAMFPHERAAWGKKLLYAGIFSASALVTAGLLFTSFFKNPGGLADSVSAFGTYFSRAGESGIHSYPWYHYLRMLVFSRFGHGPVWSEAFVLGLALVGGVSLWRRKAEEHEREGDRRFVRIISLFALISASAYSLIPYKTPWNLLPAYLGILILAGHGTAVLWRRERPLFLRILIFGVCMFGFSTLAFQNYRANFVDDANPTNPYVYAQTSRDFLKLVETTEKVAALHPQGRAMLIKVIAPPEETWPLPWYLRRFTRVGYWTNPAEAGDLNGTPVVIASATFSGETAARLGDGYQSSFYGLRPEVLLTIYIRPDLWNSYLSESPKEKKIQP